MHRVILSNALHRAHAHRLVDAAPVGAVLQISAPGRTLPQNSRLWAILSEVAAAKPGGRKYKPEVWKCLFMSAFGHEAEIIEGLNGEPFPLGFSSSRLTVKQMIELQDFIEAWCAQNGVTLSHWKEEDAAQD